MLGTDDPTMTGRFCEHKLQLRRCTQSNIHKLTALSIANIPHTTQQNLPDFTSTSSPHVKLRNHLTTHIA